MNDLNIKKENSLENDLIKQTLEKLHLDAKGDWKIMLKYAPRIIWGLMRGKSMMQSFTPNMGKDAYMPVSEEEGKLLYNIARITNSKHIVEFGSSFGVGTIYLAAAAKDNGGHIITSEIEPYKCQVTKENLKKAGVEKWVTLLEGDALQTLKNVEPNIDMVFLDGWKDIYNDVLDILLPKLKKGAVVIGDNINLPDAKQYLSRVLDEKSGFSTSIVNKVTAISCYIGNEN